MKVKVIKDVMKAHESAAADNRLRMDRAKVVSVNLMSAPGSGKTALLQKTIPLLAPARCGVLVGDLQTTRDADRLSSVTEDVVQINTGRGCHLTAAQVAAGLAALNLAALDYVFIENVGNMVCPAGFDLGEHARAALLSVPEGADKIAKYPTLYQSVQIVLLTKIDLAPLLGFDLDLVRSDLAQLNTTAPLVQCSASTGAGLEDWTTWLRSLHDSRVAG
jgi:hydrogenase nickel incorporation protein HypB